MKNNEEPIHKEDMQMKADDMRSFQLTHVDTVYTTVYSFELLTPRLLKLSKCRGAAGAAGAFAPTSSWAHCDTKSLRPNAS